MRWQKKVVQDRITHISESVYSMTEFPAKAARALDAVKEIPPTVFLVYCKPSPEFLLKALRDEHTSKAWDTDDHMDRVIRGAAQMIAFYDTVMAMVSLRCQVHVYDRTVDQGAADIITAIEERFL